MRQFGFNKTFFFWLKSVLLISCRCNEKIRSFFLLCFSQLKVMKACHGSYVAKCSHLSCSKVMSVGKLLCLHALNCTSVYFQLLLLVAKALLM